MYTKPQKLTYQMTVLDFNKSHIVYVTDACT